VSESPYIGLDIGTRRIGVARSNPNGRIAMPLETVEVNGRRGAAERIADIIAERASHTVVVGWPLTLDGQEGRAVKRVERFVAVLEQVLDERPDAEVDIVEWDERLTTTAAESFLIGADVSRRRRKQVVDQVAAAHILQGFLDSRADSQ
jgi:putative holliday junction resolvase